MIPMPRLHEIVIVGAILFYVVATGNLLIGLAVAVFLRVLDSIRADQRASTSDS